MSLKTCSLVLATVGLVAAQTSVVSLFIPFADPQPLAASILGESASTTTYSINCPPGTDGSDCGMGPGLYMTVGPKNVQYSMSEPDEDFYDSISCSMGGTTTAVCVEVASGSGANFPGTETGTFAQSEISYLAVTVTAGPATATSVSTTTDSAHTSSADKTASSGTTGSASSISGAASTSQSSATSSGGLSRVTGNPVVALGGAAAAMVAAAW